MVIQSNPRAMSRDIYNSVPELWSQVTPDQALLHNSSFDFSEYLFLCPLCFAEERVWAVLAPRRREMYPVPSHRLHVGLGGHGQSGRTLCHPPTLMELRRARGCQQNESRCVRWEGDRARCCCALGVRVRFVFSPYFNLNKTLNKK